METNTPNLLKFLIILIGLILTGGMLVFVLPLIIETGLVIIERAISTLKRRGGLLSAPAPSRQLLLHCAQDANNAGHRLPSQESRSRGS